MSRTTNWSSESSRKRSFSTIKAQPAVSDAALSSASVEAQLAADAWPSVTYQCTVDLTITSMSPNALDLVGIAPEGVLDNGVFWEERIDADDRKRLVAHLDRLDLMQTGSSFHKINDDRGLPVWVTHSFRKLKTPGGEIIVGNLIPLAHELCASKIDSSVVSQFVHQIGNHFQVGNLILGSLKRPDANAQELEALQQTMDRAVEFTRAFSRYIQAPANPGPVELFEVLDGVISGVMPLCGEANMTFAPEIEQDLAGCLVLGDAYLLELAFKCVLQNALDARGDKIVLKAQAGSLDSVLRIARILVSDNGAGMDADMVAVAAEPFVTSKRDADGLGLSTAVRLIEVHGGAVKVSSALNQGTEIEILLPLAEEPVVPE
jgi:signal transduction histidine kinase